MIFIWIAIFVLFLGLIGLSYFLWKLQYHYNTLTEGTNARTLQEILDTVMQELKTAKHQINSLHKTSQELQQDGELHIQKIGLLRFNPFKDTGGDQSFILALIDKKDTGIVISGLYSRSGTRWYAKRVVEGKGIEHELSEEEKKAIGLAGKEQGA
jgi:hypothetical protein